MGTIPCLFDSAELPQIVTSPDNHGEYTRSQKNDGMMQCNNSRLLPDFVPFGLIIAERDQSL